MIWGFYDGWSWFWMAGLMLVFWGALIGVVIWAVRALSGPRQAADPAMATLRQRLAAGELNQEEYERLRKVLQARQ